MQNEIELTNKPNEWTHLNNQPILTNRNESLSLCVCVCVCRFFCFYSSSVWCIACNQYNKLRRRWQFSCHYIYMLLVTDALGNSILLFLSFPAHPIAISNLKISLVHMVRCVEQFVQHHFGEPKKKGETTIKFQMNKHNAITATM